MNVQQLVETGRKQLQERWSAAVTRAPVVHDAKAALERARVEGLRLRGVLRQLPTVARVQGGVGAVATRTAGGFAAIAAFGKAAGVDARRAGVELRDSARRVFWAPASAAADAAEPAPADEAAGARRAAG